MGGRRAALVREAQRLVGGPEVVLIPDDTALVRQGRHSVGVARQYCGALGKTANCQVLVSVTLARDEVPVPLALRLYLPETWAADPARRHRAGCRRASAFARSGSSPSRSSIASGAPAPPLAPWWPTLATAPRLAARHQGAAHRVLRRRRQTHGERRRGAAHPHDEGERWPGCAAGSRPTSCARPCKASMIRYNIPRPHQALAWQTPAERRAEQLGLVAVAA